MARPELLVFRTHEKFDADGRLTVLKDGCCDPDPEAHRVLTEKVFARQAAVLTKGERIASRVVS